LSSGGFGSSLSSGGFSHLSLVSSS